jgi:hypothetical protein
MNGLQMALWLVIPVSLLLNAGGGCAVTRLLVEMLCKRFTKDLLLRRVVRSCGRALSNCLALQTTYVQYESTIILSTIPSTRAKLLGLWGQTRSGKPYLN